MVLPSPVMVLSLIAVAMAAVAFFATRGGEPTERQVATAVDSTPSASASESSESTAPPSDAASPSTSGSPTSDPASSSASASASPSASPTKAAAKVVDRATTFVEVYNNSGTKGLAAGVAERVGEVGWQVVGADNWYGSIPTTTVYYPPRLKAAAAKLALDLGVQRTSVAVDPMRRDRLTLILTGPLA